MLDSFQFLFNNREDTGEGFTHNYATSFGSNTSPTILFLRSHVPTTSVLLDVEFNQFN